MKKINHIVFTLLVCISFINLSCSKDKQKEKDVENLNSEVIDSAESNDDEEDVITIIGKNADGSWNYDNVTIKYPSGTIFIGKTDEDLNYIEGQIFYSNSNQTYIGSLNNEGQPNGYGKKIFENGTVFEGNWINGELRGQGKKIYADGSSVEGNFISDKVVCGKDSRIVWSNGASYVGEMDENGGFNGYGKFTFEDGSTYEGSFVDNNRTGFGVSDYNGSTYTGYYYGNLRTGKGDFSFANGYEYKGTFQQGTFCGTGYLLAQEEESIIYASNDWDGADLKKGKIITENGDVWEGGIENSQPVAGTGIWTTQEERLAKLREKGNFCQQVSYKINDKTIIVASVYTPEEVDQIIHSANYLRDFNNFYKSHKETFDKVISGMKVVSGILAVIPTPIAPYAAAVNIGLTVLDISLKTMDSGFDFYDALKAGNTSILTNIAKEYGVGIAGDVIDLMFMGTAIKTDAIGMGADVFGKSIISELTNKLASLGINPEIATQFVAGLFSMSTLTSQYAQEFFEENPSMAVVNDILQLITPIDELSDDDLAGRGLEMFGLSA